MNKISPFPRKSTCFLVNAMNYCVESGFFDGMREVISSIVLSTISLKNIGSRILAFSSLMAMKFVCYIPPIGFLMDRSGTEKDRFNANRGHALYAS